MKMTSDCVSFCFFEKEFLEILTGIFPTEAESFSLFVTVISMEGFWSQGRGVWL